LEKIVKIHKLRKWHKACRSLTFQQRRVEVAPVAASESGGLNILLFVRNAMQVNHSLRRIASLSAFVLAISITSASHAGVIPWVYDAIFGPVHHRSYCCSPYSVSYARPVVIRSYAPAPNCSTGCSSWSPSYSAPVVYAAPRSGCGGCGPIVLAPSSSPCGNATYTSTTQGCLKGSSASPAAETKPAAPVGKPAWKAPDSKTPEANQGGSTTTVTPSAATVTDDGLGTSPRSRGKANVGADVPVDESRPIIGEEEQTILKRNKTPAKIADPDFESPLENTKPKEIKKPNELELEFDGDKKAPGEAINLRPLPTLNLDAKIAWRTEPQRERVPFHAKLAKASVTRRVPGASSDWTPVVAKVTGTQVAKK
jgi:hypothetical protein